MTDNEIMTALRRCADHACYRCTEYGKEYCRETIATFAWDLNTAKVEAIKEFAERLRKELSFGKYITAEQIDNLVKEMVGEGNGQ